MRLTTGACCALEDCTEQDFDQITAKAQKGRVTELRWLLWAALQPYHGDAFAAVKDVGAVIDSVGRASVMDTLAGLLTLNADDTPKTERGTGTAAKDEPGTIWRRLYIDARAAGVPAETFWALSLRELWREMAAIRQRAKYEHDARVTQAWWIACLVWQKTLPALTKLLGTAERIPQPQTWQDIKAAVRAAAKGISGG